MNDLVHAFTNDAFRRTTGALTAERGSSSRSWIVVERRGNPRFVVPDVPHAWRRIPLAGWRRIGVAAVVPLMTATGRWPRFYGPAHLPLEDLLDRDGSQAVNIIVNVGTPSIFRKLSIIVHDAEWRPRAILKVPQSSRAAVSIDNEYATLTALQHFPGATAVPRPIERWPDPAAGVMTLQEYGAGTRPTELSPLLSSFLASLFDTQRQELAWAQSPVAARIRERLSHLAQHVVVHDAVSRGLDYLDRTFEALAIPHGRIHGDFVAWNIVLRPQPFVFDWEWSGLGLPFHDEYHYRITPNPRRARPADLTSSLFTRYATLPHPPQHAVWLVAYLTDTLSFLAEASVAHGEAPLEHAYLSSLCALLLASMEVERRAL